MKSAFQISLPFLENPQKGTAGKGAYPTLNKDKFIQYLMKSVEINPTEAEALFGQIEIELNQFRGANPVEFLETILSEKIAKFETKKPPPQPKIKLTDNAQLVLKKRYLIKNEKGVPIETPENLFRRVAHAIAEADKTYPNTHIRQTEEQFYQLMANLEFLPNSPTLMNAGKKEGQLAACFVLPIEDSMESIFETLKHTAVIQKSGGGTGFNFSKLRPKNSPIRAGQSAPGTSSGPVSFIAMFNAVTDVIKQGGTRRGANMAILNVDHPDILEFIHAKDQAGQLVNFNISVAVTNAFMKAAKNNASYPLVDPQSRSVVKELNAQSVLNEIIQTAWKTGDPGLIFMDRVNQDNPTPQVGTIEGTNPCIVGESLISTEQGLMKMEDIVKNFGTGGLKIATDNRVLEENINSSGISFHPISQAFYSGLKPVYRLITKGGLELSATADHKIMTTKGWKRLDELETGMHKILIQLGIKTCPADKKETFEDTIVSIEERGEKKVYDLTEPATHSMIVNGIVAHQCGEKPLLPYEACNLGSINLNTIIQNKKIDWDKLARITKEAVHFLDNVIDVNCYPLPQIESITKANRKIGLGVMGLADLFIRLDIPYNSPEALKHAEEIMSFIQDHALKASEQLAAERGAFPNFSGSALQKRRKKPRRNAEVTTIAPTGTISLIAGCSSGIEPIFAKSFVKQVLEGESLPVSYKDVVTAHEISPEWHVRMQALFQKYSDSAVSKTVNLPHAAAVKDVSDAYWLAYQLGCKGITVYRDRSKETQVLNALPENDTALHCPECKSLYKHEEGCIFCPKCGYMQCHS